MTSEKDNLEYMVDDLYDLYEKIKSEVRRQDSFEYERWKADGFLIDTNIVSMYPNLADLAQALTEEDEAGDDA